MIEVIGNGGIVVRMIKDSISSSGIRLRTFELEYQRMFHSETMTHRMLSKNSSSTRAIPVARAIQIVEEKTAKPIHWGSNNPGMQSNTELTGAQKEAAEATWTAMRDSVISFVKILSDKDGINGHKQWAGRALETFSFIKVVLTGTELVNLWHLRDHKDAQPEFHELAKLMQQVSNMSTPTLLHPGEWHLPYVDLIDGKYFVGSEQVSLEVARKVSASCAAQCSYRKLDDSIEKAEKVFDMLHVGDDSGQPAHASPLEHQATPMDDYSKSFNPDTWQRGITHVRRDGSLWSGNLRGWVQFRQLIPNEAVWN